MDLLKKRLVLAVPGTAFGDKRSIRLAYCVEMETITKAIPRIKEAVEEAKASVKA